MPTEHCPSAILVFYMDPIRSIISASSLPSQDVFKASISGSAIASPELVVFVDAVVSLFVAVVSAAAPSLEVALPVDVTLFVGTALSVDVALSVVALSADVAASASFWADFSVSIAEL